MKNFFLKNKNVLIANFLVSLFFFSFSLVLAQDSSNEISGLNNSDSNSTGIVWYCLSGKAGVCSYSDLVSAIKKASDVLIKYGIFALVVVIAWGGWKYMIGGGSSKSRDEVNKMFTTALWGMAWLLGAWLVVHLITSQLLNFSSPV